MKDRKYVIYVNNKPIPVSKEVYREYWRLREQEKYLVKRAKETWIYLDHFLDGYNHNTLEYDLLEDNDPTRTYSEKTNLIEMMLKEVKKLNIDEKELLYAIYVEDLTQEECSIKFNENQSQISRKHQKTLRKLRNLMKV